jgi:hypothetical protein
MIEFLSGAATIGYATVALCFLRSWKRTGDALFASFAMAFALFALNQVLIQVLGTGEREIRYEYVLRVLGFVLILIGILRKNTEYNGR